MEYVTTHSIYWDTGRFGWVADCVVKYHVSPAPVDSVALSDIEVLSIVVQSLSAYDAEEGNSTGHLIEYSDVKELASDLLYWRHLCDTAEFSRACLDNYRFIHAQDLEQGIDEVDI